MQGTRFVVRIDEDELCRVEREIFDLEKLFRRGHSTRLALYRARIEVGAARALNRENKDWPQKGITYEPATTCEEDKGCQ